MDDGDTVRVKQQVMSNRSYAISFIEALLDSSVCRIYREDIEKGTIDQNMANTLATIYAMNFKDEFYLQRAERTQKLASSSLKEKSEIIRLKNRARQLFYKGEFANARKIFEQAFQLSETIQDVDEIPAILGSIGSAHFYLGHFDSALVCYEQSLGLLEGIGDFRRIGNRLGNIASVYSDQSNYPKAISFYEKALTVRKELDDRRGMGADLNNLGLVYEEMGKYDLALSFYHQALDLNKKIENQRSIGKNLANIANVHINLGDFPEALKIYDESLAMRQEQGDKKGEGNDLGNIGIVHQRFGDYELAMIHFQEALDKHRESGYAEGEAYQLGRIASLFNQKGEYADAIKTYLEAIKIHRDMGHVRGEASWLVDLAEVYNSVGDYQRAGETLKSALDLNRQIGNRSGEAATLNEYGRLSQQNQNYPDAKTRFEKALEIHRELGEKWGECQVLGNLGTVLNLLGEKELAEKTWQKSFQFAQEIGDKNKQAWLQLKLGDFYRDRGNGLKAARGYEQGLSISEEIKDPELQWQLYFGRGQLWEQQGDDERAYFSYRAALSIIEDIRVLARVDELKEGVFQDKLEVYEAMVTLLLRLGRPDEAFEYVERSRSRNLLDILGNTNISHPRAKNPQQVQKERALRVKISTLTKNITDHLKTNSSGRRDGTTEYYFSSLNEAQQEYQRLLLDLKLNDPETSAMVQVSPLSNAQIQELIVGETALLEYFITDSKIFIFVITRDGLYTVSVPADRSSIRGRLLLFQGMGVLQMNPDKLSGSFWAKPLKGFFEMLIAPVEKAGYLKNIKHLLIVPQGLLHYVPFQALITEDEIEKNQLDGYRFLIEDYVISYAPSASVLKFFQKKSDQTFDKVLLLAPQVGVLPHTEKEVLEISKIYVEQSDTRIGDLASETLVKKSSGNYNLLHFATSAVFNKVNPLFSQLNLARSETDDGFLEVHEIFGLDIRADLVTLSACQTALGSGYTSSLPQGDDLVSLTRAFFYAGCPSVIASLWEINDPSTAAFMQTFYQYLQKHSKADALAFAQRDMIHNRVQWEGSDQSQSHAHPYFWAPFVLAGGWE